MNYVTFLENRYTDIILANRTQLILLSIIYATIVPYELTSRIM